MNIKELKELIKDLPDEMLVTLFPSDTCIHYRKAHIALVIDCTPEDEDAYRVFYID